MNIGADHLPRKHQAQAYFFMALAFKGMKAYQESIMAYNKALELCPDYSDCYFNLGNIYFEGGLSHTGEELHCDLEKASYCHL